MNGQSYCSVNFSRPLIFLVAQVFGNTGTLPQATTYNVPRQGDHWYIYPSNLDAHVWG